MDLQKLKTFQTVSTLMNFNKAAKVLNYAQSSVSAQIKSLEEEIGVELFNRKGKQISLTPKGEKMLKYANKILAIGEEAIADLNRKTAEGVLTIRAPQTVAIYYFPQIFARYNPLYPEVRFDITTCTFHNLENELAVGSVDLAFLLAESVLSSNLKSKIIGVEELVFVAYPGHELERRKNISMKDLSGMTLFFPNADCGYKMQFEKEISENIQKAPVVMEFNSIEAIKNCVKLGLGITVLPRTTILCELENNELIELSWKEKLETGVLMIWHKERWLSPALTAFIDLI